MSINHFSKEELQKIIKGNPKSKTAEKIKKSMTSEPLDVVESDVDISDNNLVAKPSDKPRVFMLDEPMKIKKKKEIKKTSLTRAGIISSDIRKNECRVSYNDNYFSVLFPESKLLTVNDLFTLLQSPKKQGVVWGYKKSWHNSIYRILEEQHVKSKAEGKKVPYFDSAVELTLFRQSPILVDKDALTTMFKYIIDAFKYDIKKNPFGILADDNPNIVHRIRCESIRAGTRNSENYVGIRIKKTTLDNVAFLPEDILKENS